MANLLEKLISKSFSQDDEGNVTFYPWGQLGRVYRLQSDEEVKNVRKFMVRFIFILPVIIVLCLVYVDSWAAWLPMIATCIYYEAGVRVILKDTDSHKQQPDESVVLKDNRVVFVMALHILSVLFTMVGVLCLVFYAVLETDTLIGRADLYVATLFFGFCSYLSGRQVFSKN